jgi:hypothetical protein
VKSRQFFMTLTGGTNALKNVTRHKQEQRITQTQRTQLAGKLKKPNNHCS